MRSRFRPLCQPPVAAQYRIGDANIVNVMIRANKNVKKIHLKNIKEIHLKNVKEIHLKSVKEIHLLVY